MRQPLLTVVLALSLTLTACDPPKTVAPPNPVGTWEEKTYPYRATQRLLTRLELKADGDFTREVRRDRVNAKTETVSGSWSVQTTEFEPPWWERIWPRRSPSDVLMGLRSKKETVRRSRIVLKYSVARGSDLAVGATVVGIISPVPIIPAGVGGLSALHDAEAGKEAPKLEFTEETWRIQEDHWLDLETDEKTGGQKLFLGTYDETVKNEWGIKQRIQSFQRVDRF